MHTYTLCVFLSEMSPPIKELGFKQMNVYILTFLIKICCICVCSLEQCVSYLRNSYILKFYCKTCKSKLIF